jgi:hypothetical protein
VTTSAIATTLIGSNHVVDSFIRYHQRIGFDYLFLFFDDPAEADQVDFSHYKNVIPIPNNEALHGKWMATGLYRDRKDLVDFVSTEVMARQALNVQVAIEMCRDLNIKWLLHIDIDELFYSPGQSVGDHFNDLTLKNITNVSYCNYEAAPSSFEVNDYFREVKLFKKNPALFNKFQLAYLRQHTRYQDGRQFFLYYQNGKSAASVATALQPKDVHSFYSGTQTFFCRTAFILHYPVCGFHNFVEKYKTLGKFNDNWFGSVPINLPFHLSARDINSQPDTQQMADFFKRHVLYTDEDENRQMLEAGLLEQIKRPSEILAGLGIGH